MHISNVQPYIYHCLSSDIYLLALTSCMFYQLECVRKKGQSVSTGLRIFRSWRLRNVQS